MSQRFRWFQTMKFPYRTALAVALAMPLLALAQSPASAPPSSPQFRSAFADYKPYQDIPAGNWRALNDAVRDADGAMAHGMAMPPSVAVSAPASAPSKATPRAPMKAPMNHSMPGGMK